MKKNLNHWQQQSGQVVVILLLIVVVSLSIGLTIIGRSTTEIATSSKIEDSSRAFFAAEAGIEKAISSGTTGNLILGNQSQADVKIDVGPTGLKGIEYPTLLKKDFAHIWLANPATFPNCAAADKCYTESSFNVFFGNPELTAASSEKPAIEVNVVTRDGTGAFASNRYYYDSDLTRASTNGFTPADSPLCRQSHTADTIINAQSNFYCKVTVPPVICNAPNCTSYISKGTPVLVRLRLLYMDSQKVAVVPLNSKPLPPQIQVYTSVGKAGGVQRVLRVIRETNVVPQLFDYAIFSAADIKK